MARRAKGPLIELPADTGLSGAAMYRRLAEHIQQMILTGTLPAGERLPSTRQMAADMKCSRNTVANAIDHLEAEGYITSRRGAGTYVAEQLPEEVLQQAPVEIEMVDVAERKEPQFSDYMRRMFDARPARKDKTPTFSRQPDLSAFPFELWAQLYRDIWEQPKEKLVRDEDPLGHLPLRQAIAEHLSHWRGINCTAEQIMITTGTTQALHFLTKLLVNDGDCCWVEEPGFLEAKSAIKSVGARAVPVAADKDGLIVDQGIKQEPDSAAIFVTPSHQHPLGHVMSMDRRRELLEHAYRCGAWVIEDDHDAEIRHKGGVQPALKSMDSADHVIYVGTFSKILFQSLRIGFVVLPERLLTAAETIRSYTELCPSIVMQPVLARFISEGHFVSYLRRVRLMYEAKMKFFLEHSREILGEFLDVREDPIGTHVVAYFREGRLRHSDVAYSDLLQARGIHATPLSDYFSVPNSQQGFVLGYGSASEREMLLGLEAMRDVFSTEISR